jgi:hypothetical protein
MGLNKAAALANIGSFVIAVCLLFRLIRDGSSAALMNPLPWLFLAGLVLAGYLNFAGARIQAKASDQSKHPASAVPSLAPSTQTEHEPDASVTLAIPAPDISKQAIPESFPVTGRVRTLTIPVGSVHEFGEVKIDVRELRRNETRQAGETDYGAVVYISTGGGLVFGGERTTRVSTNCYYLPLNPIDPTKEPYSVYFHHFSDQYVHSFSLYLEHVNPHSSVVTVKVCSVGSFLSPS